MTVFATPEPTWTALVAALDEDPPDEVWAFKLAIQCRDHLKVALQHSYAPELLGGPALTEWARDPGKRAPKRPDGAIRPWRTAKDIPGGPTGPQGFFQRWHVLLGVLIGHEYEESRQEAPAWTRPLRLDKEWVVSEPRMSDHQIRNSAPPWLSERGIFVSKTALVR